jgi:hypothetical protein
LFHRSVAPFRIVDIDHEMLMFSKSRNSQITSVTRQANLFARNEIVVHASCEKALANIVDAQLWPSWYPHSHNVARHEY